MPTGREILYTIRMRNEARAAIRQLSSDLQAQGTTLRQVARQMADAQAQANKMGSAMSGAARNAGQLATAVQGADTTMRSAQGVTVYRQRLMALQGTLAALPAQFAAASAAAAAYASTTPPRLPATGAGGGASPPTTPPPVSPVAPTILPPASSPSPAPTSPNDTFTAAAQQNAARMARLLQAARVALAQVGQEASNTATKLRESSRAANGLGGTASGIKNLAATLATLTANASVFASLRKEVARLDTALASTAGIGAYRAQLASLSASLVQLQGDYRKVIALAQRMAGLGGSGPVPPVPIPAPGPIPAPTPAPRPAGGGSGTGNGSAGSTRSQLDFNRALGETQSRIGQVRSALAAFAILSATAFGARRVLGLADEYTKVISQLKLVTDGTQNLTDSYDALLAVSNRNRTSMASTTEIYTKFNQATRTLGVSQREVLEVTDSVSKAVAIFGGNSQSAQAALFQFSQGLSSGTLRGEELNSVLEQAPRLAAAIAAGLKNAEGGVGIPIGALRTYAEQGKLTTEAIFNALRNQRVALEADFAKTGVTIGQAFEVAKNYAIDFVGKADAATGASRRIGEAIIQAVKGLQNPAAISAMQTALSGFASAVSTALSALRLLSENVQLVATGLAVIAALRIVPMFLAMGAAASGAASQLLVYSVATRGVAVAASAASIATRGLSVAMGAIGGPIGLAITAAAGALTYWLTQTKASVTAGTDLAAVTDKLRANYDAATNSVKGLTAAERARETLKTGNSLKGFADEIQAQAKALNSAIAPGFFEATNGAKLSSRFLPFRTEIEAFRKSVQAGKADFKGLQDAAAIKAEANPALRGAATELMEAAEAGAKAQDGFGRAAATMKVLKETATATEAAVAGVNSTLDRPAKVDGTIALQQATENLKKIAAEVPALKTLADNQAAVSAAQNTYTAVLRDLKVALDAGTLSQGSFNAKVLDAETTLARAKAAINGVTQAQRDLADADRDLRADMRQDRAKAVEEINIKYDRLNRATKEQVTDEAEMNRIIAARNAMRAQEINNIDTKFQNGDLKDRITAMQDEARLLGLSGEARERAAAMIEVERAARKAGVADVDAMVAAYGKEYDALEKAKQSRQTIGDGFNTAVTRYIEDARKVGDESARMFGSIFNTIEDGFVDVVKNGSSGFKNMLDSIANDLLKFASRQLFRSLLSSVFGDGQGGTAGAGGIGSIGTMIMSAFGVKAAPTTAASASSVAAAGIGSTLSNVVGGGAGGAVSASLSSSANGAATAVANLSSAATSATGSFGDIPSKLSSMLKGLGATDAGVAGFLGNVQAESGFKPNVVNSNGGAYGLIQALGPRKRALLGEYGPNPTADQQIEFIRKELTSSEGASLKMLRSATTLEDGVKAGIRFERPEGYVKAVAAGDLSLVNDYGARLKNARGFATTGLGPTASQQAGGFDLQGATLSDETVNKLNSQFDEISTKTAGLDTSFSQMGNSLDRANPQILNGVEGVTGSLNQGGSQLGKAFNDVALDVSSSGNALQNAFQKMVQSLGSSDGAWANLGIGKLFNVGSGFAGDGLDLGAGSLSSWVMHTGGIVGTGAGVTRSTPAGSSLWDGAPRYHAGGIVQSGGAPGMGLKSRERAIIAKDDEAIFPTVRMSDGNFGIRATGFTGSGGGNGGNGGGGNVTFGDIIIQTQGSSGNAAQDQAHQKAMAREVKESMRAMVREELQSNMRGGGLFSATGMARR
ncbi:phage tail tip lysozyme [Methylobacterium bullatum]|uniref:Tape measure protein n=1 Tax=Methylobacterium bullatum TaxID=570505 RepID=A0AAV4ZB41_9HYPH|nr:phage tail tip lysozyme [Methylobacterium bullatum]MBD8900647.1 hypothetical protein [Methylobacterium bullatum]GJD40854.1 hypothetical protein OICFNHDK_3330 [Methylobacterium bullatum]